ncbi:MAG: nodulation protein NfeD [Acidobacteriota bacterium]
MRTVYVSSILVLIILTLTLPVNGSIFRLTLNGPIDTIAEEYITNSYKKIDKDPESELIIIEIDTPGGFSTSMRTIIKEIMNSRVPTAVYVSPRGARAASAGFLITISSNIAVMAPGTNMGAAHPVAIMGKEVSKTMNEKITNDAVSYVKSLAKSKKRNIELAAKAVKESKSYTAEECLKGNLIDLIADNIEDLIKKIKGKKILLSDGSEFILSIKDPSVIKIEMSGRQKFLRTITNPNLAYFLLIIGLIGLYIEFTHPGAIIPGVLGGISLLLAFMAFQVLPLNYVGLMMILLSVGFFIAEVKIQGFGIFGIGGILSFALGSIILINAPIPEMRPAMATIISVTVCFGIILLFLAYKVIKAMNRKTETGQEGIVGETGKALTPINPDSGKVFVHGEIWKACSDVNIPQGKKIEVISIKNLILKVIQRGG